MASTIPVSLVHSQFLNRICAHHVRVRNGLFDSHIVVSLAIHIDLQAVIHHVGLIFHIQFVLHAADIAFNHAHFYCEIGAVPVDPVELNKHQIQTTLQRIVINRELAQVFVGGRVDWVDCRYTLLWPSQEAI